MRDVETALRARARPGEPVVEAVSSMQRHALRRYAEERGLAFCDMTDGFRARVREGVRGLYGARDDGHWSKHGTEVAASVLLECFDAIGVR